MTSCFRHGLYLSAFLVHTQPFYCLSSNTILVNVVRFTRSSKISFLAYIINISMILFIKQVPFDSMEIYMFIFTFLIIIILIWHFDQKTANTTRQFFKPSFSITVQHCSTPTHKLGLNQPEEFQIYFRIDRRQHIAHNTWRFLHILLEK